MPKTKFSYEDYQKMMQDIMDEYDENDRIRRVGQRMPTTPLAERVRQSAQRLQELRLPKV